MKKVKAYIPNLPILTREQHEAVQALGNSSIQKDTALIATRKRDWTTKKYKALNDLSLDELATALYQGYEVKETPEEIILNMYEQLSLCKKEAMRSVVEALQDVYPELKTVYMKLK